MRIERLYIKDFKNLRDFSINFETNELTTVLIGQNGTGKSNLLEALVLIFRALDLNEEPPFAYSICYLCRGQLIDVSTKEQDGRLAYSFRVGPTDITRAAFQREKDAYLPRHVFAYYSGPSQRLAGHFEKHLEKFYKDSKKGRTENLRRLFLCRGVHSQFVLLAFYAFQEKADLELLQGQLGLKELDSVLFVLKKPGWKQKRGDDNRFWGAAGLVHGFLDALWDKSLAPLYHKELFRDDFRKQKKPEARLFLFLPRRNTLAAFAASFGDAKTFFTCMETTDLSDLIREVRIRVQREGVDGFLTFKELSEGEQQLLAVLGLLKFTKQDESLFLLDEPDTHLNPAWKLGYLKLLQDVVAPGDRSHLLIATHDPLVIGGLTKREVRVLARKDARIVSLEPEADPKGMGFANLLQSDLYGLRAAIDPETLALLDERYALYAKGSARTAAEDETLRRRTEELSALGYATTFRDPYFEAFIKALARHPKFARVTLTAEELKEQERITDEIVAEIVAEEEE